MMVYGGECMRRFLALCLALSLVCPKETKPRGYIALTFDDGPSGKITKRLLDGLSERDAKATFFVCCYRMEQYPDTLNQIASDGHELGLHSCCHQHMHQMTRQEVLEDLEACETVLSEYTGVQTRLFRPPGGLYSDTLCQAAGEAGYSVILWSVNPEDFQPGNGNRVLPYLQEHTQHGDIVLLHDLYPATVDAALSFIDHMRLAGYEFCTVSQLAAQGGVELQPGAVYWNFRENSS